MINGGSLTLIFEDKFLSKNIQEIFQEASSIILYRSSPIEKAMAVKFVMKTDKNAFTLAIGDGGNDVNMI